MNPTLENMILSTIKSGIVQQEKIGYELRLDSSVVRNLASKLIVEGKLLPIKTKEGKIFYRIAIPSPKRVINTDQSYVVREILREVNSSPNKSIRYISDKISVRGIGKGYWSNQKIIRQMERMGFVTLKRNYSTSRTTIEITAKGENRLYNQDTEKTKTVNAKPVVNPAEKGFRFRIDSTVEGFARQIENLKTKYPEVTTFILKPVQPKI